MKKIIIALLLVTMTTYTHAQSGGRITDAPPVTTQTVLIPYDDNARVAFLAGSLVNAPSGAATGSLLSFVGGSGVNNYRIMNTSLLGGLPEQFPGLSATSLSGICASISAIYQVLGGSITYNDIYVCGTMPPTGSSTPNHYILEAQLPTGGMDYVVTAVYEVTASFAPATSGWLLHHIQYNGSALYGLFTNGTSTYLAEITISGSTATASSVEYFSGTCYNAMVENVAGMDLLDLSAPNILHYPGTTTTSLSSSFSSSPGCGAWATDDNFLVRDPELGELLYNGNGTGDVYLLPPTYGMPTPTTWYTLDFGTTTIAFTTAWSGFYISGSSE